MTDDERTRQSAVRFWAAAGAVVVLDQLTKLLARAALGVDRPVAVVPGFFDLKLRFNSGAAFGILPDWAPLFILAALVAIYAIARLRQAGEGSRGLALGLGLVMGGALGNLVDRLASAEREVTDFLSFYIRLGGKTYAWPTFNLADAAIVVGAILVICHVYVIEKRRTNG